MGLKEQVEQARRAAQARKQGEEEALARSRAQDAAYLQSRAEAMKKIWDEAYRQFENVLREHQENMNYTRPLLELALTQITPALKRLEASLRGRYPYIKTGTKLDDWGPRLIESEGRPVICSAKPAEAGVMYYNWGGTVCRLESGLEWGQYPWTEYYRGIFHKERWQKANYSRIEVQLDLSASDLESFGNLLINGRTMPFSEWQTDPAKINYAIGEAFSHPRTFQFDRPVYEPPYESTHMPSDGAF